MKGCSRKSSDLGGKKGYGVVVLDALNERLLPKEQRHREWEALVFKIFTLNERLLPKEQRRPSRNTLSPTLQTLNERLLPKEQRRFSLDPCGGKYPFPQ